MALAPVALCKPLGEVVIHVLQAAGLLQQHADGPMAGRSSGLIVASVPASSMQKPLNA
jgi:hypothetical protein